MVTVLHAIAAKTADHWHDDGMAGSQAEIAPVNMHSGMKFACSSHLLNVESRFRTTIID